MPLARGILWMETLQDLGAIMNRVGLFDKQVICAGDNWAVGVGAWDSRRRCQAVMWGGLSESKRTSRRDIVD